MNRTSLFRFLALLLTLALALVACGSEEPVADEPLDEEPLEEVEPLLGQQLTVSGEVSEVLEPGAFVVSGEDFAFGEPVEGAGTLILSATDEPVTVEPGDVAQITGEVVRVVIADLEAEYGFDYDDDLLVEYSDELGLVAQQIEVVPAGADEEPGVEPTGGEDEFALTDGEQVTLGGTVDAVMTPFAFALHTEETDTDVLVLNAGGAAITDLEEGAAAQVEGTVMEFVIVEVEEELGVDLDDELFAEFDRELVVIADSVQIVPS